MAHTASKSNSDPSQDHQSGHRGQISANVGVAGALLTGTFILIDFPTGVSRVTAVVACILTTGLLSQAVREEISSSLTAWLLATGLAVVSLIFVLADGHDTSEVPPAAGAQVTEAPSRQRAVPDTPSPTGRVSTPLPAGTMLLDELPVTDTRGQWRHGDVTLANETYEGSLAAPANCEEGTFISYNLYRQWTGFSVTIGVVDDAPNGSLATFSIRTRSEELYGPEVLAIGGSKDVDLDVEGVFRLTLQTHTCYDDYIGAWGTPTLSR